MSSYVELVVWLHTTLEIGFGFIKVSLILYMQSCFWVTVIPAMKIPLSKDIKENFFNESVKSHFVLPMIFLAEFKA